MFQGPSLCEFLNFLSLSFLSPHLLALVLLSSLQILSIFYKQPSVKVNHLSQRPFTVTGDPKIFGLTEIIEDRVRADVQGQLFSQVRPFFLVISSNILYSETLGFYFPRKISFSFSGESSSEGGKGTEDCIDSNFTSNLQKILTQH